MSRGQLWHGRTGMPHEVLLAFLAIPIVVLLAACGASEPAATTAPAAAAPSASIELIRVTGANPFAGLPGCGRNDFFGSKFESAEVEPMLAVNPANPDDLVATWFQDASLTYASAVSRDGGRSWRTYTVPGISACDGGGAHAAADSWLSIGPDGAIYLSGFSVFLDALPAPLPTRTTMQVSRGAFTSDGGLHWSAPSVVQAGFGVFHDRPVVTADPRRPGTAYVLWNDGTQVPPLVVQPLMFARSDNGGATWSNPALVHLPPVGVSHEGEIHVLPDGTLLATYAVIRTNPLAHQMLAKRSLDGGRTWPLLAVTIAESPAGALQPTGGDCRTLAAPVRDAEGGAPCVQMPENELSADIGPDGSIHVAWAHWMSAGHSEIRVSRSTDGGRSWSAPTSVSAASGGKAIPALAVAADGTVGVSWYDFRSDVAGDEWFSGEVWFAQSGDGGASWRERRIAGPFDMRSAPHRLIPFPGLFLGDYFGLVALPDGFGALFALPAPYAVEGTTDLFYARVEIN